MKSGLYGLHPDDKTNYVYFRNSQQNFTFLTTVNENLKYLSLRQKEKAKQACKLYHALGTPTIGDLKAMIRMNLIKNNNVTTEDVHLATKVYGPDAGAIKGKTTRQKPIPVTSNIIKIPKELL